ncbi:phthioceranic/hydroxyphthioceranic acid synthase [Striga asiatica]|uniref:Phthioceranic/hydroxyphthioceranic acid synthase n=1 Tax=Striga asiatica TaxID=4170 RepID=A0A5A7PUI6_STRAF|nr:phthioceranic/hydroxyphthioceranic acid synthase [Striga asiatica]
MKPAISKMSTIITFRKTELKLKNQTYASQPVLLNVWKIKHRSRPLSLDSQDTSSSASCLTLASTLYSSTYLLRCLGFAPSHPSITTAISGPPSWTAIPSPKPLVFGPEAKFQRKEASYGPKRNWWAKFPGMDKLVVPGTGRELKDRLNWNLEEWFWELNDREENRHAK